MVIIIAMFLIVLILGIIGAYAQAKIDTNYAMTTAANSFVKEAYKECLDMEFKIAIIDYVKLHNNV